MVSRVKRYFLEIKDFSKTIDLNLPENYKIVLDNKDNFHLNKFFYNDKLVIEEAEKSNIPMVFTGRRHFKH